MSPPQEPFDPSEQPFSAAGVIEMVRNLVIVVAASVVLNLFVIQVTEVRQRSMEPTLVQSDRVLMSKLDYRFGAPRRGDVIVFNPPVESGFAFVKRVIAVGGDTIDLRDGKVLVNGAPEDTPDAVGPTSPQSPRHTYPLTVPAGTVWTMGDNRPESMDSRSYGPVAVDGIIGKVMVRFWPLTGVRFFGL